MTRLVLLSNTDISILQQNSLHTSVISLYPHKFTSVQDILGHFLDAYPCIDSLYPSCSYPCLTVRRQYHLCIIERATLDLLSLILANRLSTKKGHQCHHWGRPFSEGISFSVLSSPSQRKIVNSIIPPLDNYAATPAIRHSKIGKREA